MTIKRILDKIKSSFVGSKSDVDSSRIFTSKQIEDLLGAAKGKTLLQVDGAKLFERYAKISKVTGIAGQIVEASILHCKLDSKQEADILIDGIPYEIKTTGMIKPKKGDSPYSYECKEPVSVTAVSISKIVNEEFEDSNFWHKLAHMLWVYYFYNSPITVKLDGYKNFPILGFQKYEFNEKDRTLLKQDWILVHDFLVLIHKEYHTQKAREEQYPRLSHELRGQLMLIDTAPKFPNNPRFRLKRAFATVIADKLFSKKKFEVLKESFNKYADLDRKCELLSEKYKGKSFARIALELGMKSNLDAKNFAEPVVVQMFGGHVKKLNDIEDFAKLGIIAKSVPFRSDGKGKEDMKLFLPNLEDWTRETNFEESTIYEYFTGHHFLFIMYKYVDDSKDPDKIVFEGFKRIYFKEDFIEDNVKRLWDDIRDLIMNNKLQIVRSVDKNGNEIKNNSGSYMEAPNFPKKATHKVFVRGGATSSDEKYKTLEINGLKMIPQNIWLDRNAVQELIK